MRVLLSWLHDYVEFTGTARDLARVLTEIGLAVTSVQDLGGGDAILDVEVTSNRGDCLSHVGIAREVAAALGQSFRSIVQPDHPATEGPEAAADLFDVDVEAGDLCPAYGARVLLGLDNRRETPAWIRRRLDRLGVRRVNPVVDVTNFLLLARGQPLHAFDRARLAGGRIRVRRSVAGEWIETLDGRRRTLPAGLLVIADAERPVAVAGVMGGKDSEVGPHTTDVVIESARFHPAAVRESAAALGLHTEASARFGRRVDPEEMVRTLDRAAALMVDACAGRSAAGRVIAGPDAAAAAPPPRRIRLRFDRLRAILGDRRISNAEAAAYLASLALVECARDEAAVTVEIPTYRGDLVLEEDLVEEIARLRGYAAIPAEISLPVRPVPRTRGAEVLERCRGAMVGAGFRESLTLPFVAPGLPDDVAPWECPPAVRVINPVREEEPLLRRSLLGPLLRSLERNRARGVEDVRLFEMSTVFLPAEGRPAPRERKRLGGVGQGGFPVVRGAVEAVLEGLGLVDGTSWSLHPDPVSPFAAGAVARIERNGVLLGWVGEIDARHLGEMGVHREGLAASAFELDFDALEETAILERTVRAVPVHPQVVRDLAVLLPSGALWSDVAAAVRAAGGPLLRDLHPFDDYRGRGVPAGSKSLAFRMTFGAPDRTLDADTVERALRGILEALSARFGAALRGV